MRNWIVVPALCGVLLATSSVTWAASDLYSPLPYVSREGWHWDSDSGLWRNPKARYDRNAKTWVHDTRLPSTTACCDRTGLWLPGDAANSFDDEEPPKRSRKAAGGENSIREQLRRKLAAKAQRDAEDAARRPGVNYGYAEDDEPGDIQAKARAIAASRVPSTDYSSIGGSAASGSESETSGPSLSDVGDAVSGMAGLASGLLSVGSAAAGLAAGRSAPSVAAPSFGAVTQQARTPQPVYRPAPRPHQSDITGLK